MSAVVWRVRGVVLRRQLQEIDLPLQHTVRVNLSHTCVEVSRVHEAGRGRGQRERV